MNEFIGYVITRKDYKGHSEYYRGCARGRDVRFSKSLMGAQIYKGKGLAVNTLLSDKLKYYRDSCEIVKIKIQLIEED